MRLTLQLNEELLLHIHVIELNQFILLYFSENIHQDTLNNVILFSCGHVLQVWISSFHFENSKSAVSLGYTPCKLIGDTLMKLQDGRNVTRHQLITIEFFVSIESYIMCTCTSLNRILSFERW
jgi:hypothetical protein